MFFTLMQPQQLKAALNRPEDADRHERICVVDIIEYLIALGRDGANCASCGKALQLSGNRPMLFGVFSEQLGGEHGTCCAFCEQCANRDEIELTQIVLASFEQQHSTQH